MLVFFYLNNKKWYYKMQVKINKSDIIWSYLGVIVSFTVSMLSFPIVIFFLDGDLLGLWYVFASIGSISLLFDFGFTLTFARNITYCWSGAKGLRKEGTNAGYTQEPDFCLMRDILITCKRVYLIISLIALFLMLTIGTGYILYISKGVSGYVHVIAWVIYAISTFLNLYYNYYDSFLRGVGSVKQANQNRVIARLAQLVIMVVLLIMGMGILGLAIASLSFGVIFRYLGKYYFYNYRDIGKELNKIKSPVDNTKIKNLFFTVWFNAWRDGIVTLSFYLSSQVSVILCSLYLTLTETGIYSVCLQIVTIVMSLSVTLLSTYQPMMQSSWIKKNMNTIRIIMSRILVVYILSYMIGVLGVLFLGIPILHFIKPELIIPIPLLLGLFLSMFILKFRDCFTTYMSCSNRLIYMKAFLISSVLCVIFSLILMHFFHMKAWGLVFGQILSQLVFNAWYWPYKANNELHLHPSDFKNVFAKKIL